MKALSRRESMTRWSPFPTFRALLACGCALTLLGVATVSGAPAASASGERATAAADEMIVFSSRRDGNSELYAVRADGSGLTRLTNHPAVDAFPNLSPDGSRVAFVSTRHGNFELYVMNLDGTGLSRLTNHSAIDSEPDWSPDGARIVFTSRRSGNGDIYSIKASDGSALTRLTSHSSVDASPAWSPDGSQIAFTSLRSGLGDIYRMQADGSQQQRLTTSGAPDLFPAWAPNGEHLAFASLRSGNSDIYTMQAGGGQQTRVTKTAAVESEPAWSPDGSRLAITSNAAGPANFDLRLIGLDGSGGASLAPHPALDVSPDWAGPGEDEFDGTVQPVVDTPSAATATVGRDGGQISAGGVTLRIPAGALTEAEAITVTPLLGLNGSPLQGQVIGATFAPDGLALLKPAILSFAAPAGTQPANVLTFAFAGDGEDFHLVPHVLQSGIVELEIWHFSGAGGSFGSFGSGTTWTPGTAETRALQELSLAAAACAQTGDPASQACTVELADRSRSALLRWYVDAVEPALRAALGAPSLQVEDAFEEWLRWGAQVNRFGANFPLLTLQNRLDEAEVLARKALADLTVRRLNNCTGTDLTSQLRDVIRVSDLALAGTVDLTLETLPGTLEPLPDAFNAGLMRACASVRIEPPAFPKVAARVDANQLTVRAYLGTYTGAQIMTQPLELTLTLTNADSDASQGLLDSNGGFQTNVYPFAGVTGVIVDIDVALGSSALPQLTDVTVRENLASVERVVRFARDRIELEPLPGVSTTVSAGASAPLKVRVAGNGMENATVNYSVSGVGSLSSTSGVTDQDGEAPTFDYVAPSNPSGASATVTATLGGDQDSVTFTIANAQVSVSPSSVSLAPGETRQFTAMVTGTANTAVTWSATGGTISQTGLYTAGPTAGNFTVTATSVEDPTKSASATVTISSVPHSVTRLSSVGFVYAVVGTPVGAVCEARVESPSGATAWSDTRSCSGAGASGTATVSFTESYAGDNLVAVTASSSSTASSGDNDSAAANGAGDYELNFLVTQTTNVLIDAQMVSGVVCCSDFLLVRNGSVILFNQHGGSVSQTVTLTPGTYVMAISAIASSCCPPDFSDSASFSLNLTFGS